MASELIDGKYEILEERGRGAQGSVYKARHALLDEFYAIKMISPEISAHPDQVNRFRAEAQTMAKFRHENIVRVHNLILRDERPYCLVLDYVDGPNLAEYIRNRGALAPADALEIARQLASALDHAHSFRVWHRDVKPRNVLVAAEQPWRVLLTDFGIAKLQDATDRTKTGHVVGTTRYSAPEQLGYTRRIDGARVRVPVDQRTDVFGLGLVLYEMLTGKQFFHDMDLADVIDWIYDLDAPGISLPESVPGEVGDVVKRALARDPEDRHASMADLLHAIASCQRNLYRAVTADRTATGDSAEFSDDKLNEEILRLERERLRRQVHAVRAQVEAARERAQGAQVPALAGESFREAEALQARAQEAHDGSRFEEAVDLFEAVAAKLERAIEEAAVRAAAAARDTALAAQQVAQSARAFKEAAGAPERAGAAFATAGALEAAAVAHAEAERWTEAEGAFVAARRSYEAIVIPVATPAEDLDRTQLIDTRTLDTTILHGRGAVPPSRDDTVPLSPTPSGRNVPLWAGAAALALALAAVPLLWRSSPLVPEVPIPSVPVAAPPTTKDVPQAPELTPEPPPPTAAPAAAVEPAPAAVTVPPTVLARPPSTAPAVVIEPPAAKAVSREPVRPPAAPVADSGRVARSVGKPSRPVTLPRRRYVEPRWEVFVPPPPRPRVRVAAPPRPRPVVRETRTTPKSTGSSGWSVQRGGPASGASSGNGWEVHK